MPVIPVLGRMKQENYEFLSNLDCVANFRLALFI